MLYPLGQVIQAAGENFSVKCSKCSMSISRYSLPMRGPDPNFEWLFDPSKTSLPTGVWASEVINDGGIYVSTLKFCPL